MRIYHEQMKLLFAVFVVNGGNEHTAGINAHHRTGRKIRDGDAGLADQIFGLIISMNSA